MRVPSAIESAAFAAAAAMLFAIPTFESGPVTLSAATSSHASLDAVLRQRAANPQGVSPAIVRAHSRASLPDLRGAIARAGGALGRELRGINGQVAMIPDAALAALAARSDVASVSLDRVIVGAMDYTSPTVGATAVRQELGYDGAGITVAVVDSGVTPWHDDLADGAGNQRVVGFVDFVNAGDTPYDDYGHGTHVAGIIAGNGFDSSGARTGVAPAAGLLVLKALDASGRGRISNVIAAIDYALERRAALNLRVINLSVASGVYESFNTDPLALATERAVRAGIVVVTAAGNHGVSPEDRTRYRGITSPGNSPWVLTVGASSHMGTIARQDDTVAVFSSRGPAAIDEVAKPDIVAPGVGVTSLAAPESAFYSIWSPFLLSGAVPTAHVPYLSLTGTSMASPVVAGTVALMLQANPSLTPNEVKAILQYTAQASDAYDPLTLGAGFVNTRGAVLLARYLASTSGTYPDTSRWGRRLIWGNYAVKNGRITHGQNAWSAGLRWGAAQAADGSAVTWGLSCTTPACDTSSSLWTFSTAKPRNVVWGFTCGGADCSTPWTVSAVTAASDGDTVVWGTTDAGETVVWGTTDVETVVWGTIDAETVVWGTTETDTVVWGTGCTSPSCQPVLWPR
jgi:serine protease AprX